MDREKRTIKVVGEDHLDEDGDVWAHFEREFTVPYGYDMKRVSCEFYKDMFLTIEIPIILFPKKETQRSI
ncbi:unnamed protein product [Cuscuta campestris]|uniref:SHSP domain-containing protein n=1 Tax=Cuscuta campestris TaxID=132261 RepID=A0A484N4W8_9ASTE|nr:unnamed protein product [Cuscuta campestris]